MSAKKIFQLFVAFAVLAMSLASTGSALAGGYCANYVTVRWGDTLSGIAAAYGTTVYAIQAANPGLGWWLYAGQVLCMPTGYMPPYNPPQTGGTYVVQWGDTLGKIAARYGISLSALIAANPQIWNPSLIYPGQVINLPGAANYPPPPSNYPPPPSNYPPPTYPPPPDTSQFSVLKVTYQHGLLVRTGPGKSYSEIVSPYVSAVKNTNWWYRKSSVTVDSSGFVWVEVKLSQ
ncbi:MAG: LysM peptidoglycan-binding domain-containing protein, partial [Bacteroidota bacterium]